jgi:hypothetical protein
MKAQSRNSLTRGQIQVHQNTPSVAFPAFATAIPKDLGLAGEQPQRINVAFQCPIENAYRSVKLHGSFKTARGTGVSATKTALMM